VWKTQKNGTRIEKKSSQLSYSSFSIAKTQQNQSKEKGKKTNENPKFTFYSFNMKLTNKKKWSKREIPDIGL
jgi:hypothetical protein